MGRHPARCWLVAAMLLATLATPARARAREAAPLVAAVKAAFLYKFQFYVDWPPRAFASAGSPFRLCIVGDDPFGPLIDRAVADPGAGARAVQVVRLRTVSPADGCQMLFVGGRDAAAVRQVLAAITDQPVLTVTDLPPAEGGTAGGSMINFVIADDRVRFQIDRQAASRGGVAISSKLLSLALPGPQG